MADYLRCTERHINTLMQRGVLPYVKERGFVRFDLEECNRALEAFKTKSLFALPHRRSPLPTQSPRVAPMPPGNSHSFHAASSYPNPASDVAGELEATMFSSFKDASAACEHQGKDAHERQIICVIVVSTTHPSKVIR
jgi:hypothetical protein